MSTRSGKRIHSSFQEDAVKSEAEFVLKSKRKTRSKNLKENTIQLDVTLPKSKKRNNYVSYPTEDDHIGDAVSADITEGKNSRKLRRNTLKEQNAIEPASETLNTDVESKKRGRLTRRTKKISENVEDTPENVKSDVVIVPNGKLKGKKNKKKKSKSLELEQEAETEVEEAKVIKKKTKKKQKGKRLSSMIIEDIQPVESTKNIWNKSNTSIDSFHSAAGSPLRYNSNINKELVIEKPEPIISKNVTTTFEKIGPTEEASTVLNNTIDKETKKSKNPSLTNTTFDKNIQVTSQDLNSTFDKIDVGNTEKLNTSLENEPKARQSTSGEAKVDISETLNGTCDKSSRLHTTISLNSTYDKESENKVSESLNGTFENKSSKKSNTISLNSTYDKVTENKEAEILNGTFEIKSSIGSLDSTCDKETEHKLDTTFDKTQSKSNSLKSSLISSDGTVNLTYDKSTDNSRISITSDDSRTENIVNMTPLLIESSIEESQLFETSNSTKNSPVSKSPDLPPTNTSTTDDSNNPKAIPPMTREGTFTKEGPEVIESSKRKISTEKTPTKRRSLPSPGCTPFHTTRSSKNEKSILNVAQSIEKSTRRSSLAEVVARQTKVMFCSPVNNPALVMQQKRKVIKSSLKGSNKSFIFDESVSKPPPRPGVRKRSFTQGDAEDQRAKRTRLADDLQLSVARLSRPRTSSAVAKLPEPTTPSKKPATPSKTKSETKTSRTKLPNFAALHQRRFDKMESLDECQERKAKRARQLLTPTGGVAVLERSSPRGITINPLKPEKEPNTSTKESKKSVTASEPALPTLESLRPGYTRFGFKMNIGFNPFSIPSKIESKPKESKPKRIPRQATLPSLTGTTVRKEVAKQTVMREKSFTSLSSKRDVKRKENRTIIKGVRTNRRFELQMKMREIN